VNQSGREGASDGRRDQKTGSSALYFAGRITEEHLYQPEPVEAMVLQVAASVQYPGKGLEQGQGELLGTLLKSVRSYTLGFLGETKLLRGTH
jgi:hypothetical protein